MLLVMLMVQLMEKNDLFPQVSGDEVTPTATSHASPMVFVSRGKRVSQQEYLRVFVVWKPQ